MTSLELPKRLDCLECGGTYLRKCKAYTLNEPKIGKIPIHRVPYYQCNKCKSILYTEEMCLAIETKRQEN